MAPKQESDAKIYNLLKQETHKKNTQKKTMHQFADNNDILSIHKNANLTNEYSSLSIELIAYKILELTFAQTLLNRNEPN